MNKLIIVVTAMLFALPLAFGQNNRSWVASTGNDSNACTRAQPCATFQGALGKTNANGEIDVVDPGEYGEVSIPMPVTIDGGGIGRITEAPGYYGAVQIGNVSGPVTLRNLSIQAGEAGIVAGIVSNAPLVHIENVSVSSFHTSQYFVGISIVGGTATLDRVVVQDADYFGIYVLNGAVVRVRDSIVTNAPFGIVAVSSTITVDISVITNCGTGIDAANSGTVRLSSTTVTDNTYGLSLYNGGSIISFVNNRISGNGTDGSPTKSVYQR